MEYVKLVSLLKWLNHRCVHFFFSQGISSERVKIHDFIVIRVLAVKELKPEFVVDLSPACKKLSWVLRTQ